MALRPISFSIPSTTQLLVSFSDDLSLELSVNNFKVESLNGSVLDLEVLSIEIDKNAISIKTRPQVSGNYYILKFLDTTEVVFASSKGQPALFDSNSRELFFVGIDNVNPIRDRMFEKIPSIMELDNSNLKNILSAQAEEFYTAQKTLGEILSNNYLSIEIKDEFRTRSAGATDRLSNENAYEIIRVARQLTSEQLTYGVIDYTLSNDFKRNNYFPALPVSLQEEIVVDEVISLDSESNSFIGFLLNLKNKNVIKLLSLKHIASTDVEDCDGNIGTFYDIEKYKYTIKDNLYDSNFAFKFSTLESNQILLSEFGNINKPSVLDTIIISYAYKNLSKKIEESSILVSRVEDISNESIPTNVSHFYLKHAPIVNYLNEILTSNGVSFFDNENLQSRRIYSRPDDGFRTERYRFCCRWFKSPSNVRPGIYSSRCRFPRFY